MMSISTFHALSTLGNPEKEIAVEYAAAYHKKIRAYGLPSCQSIIYFNQAAMMFNQLSFAPTIGFLILADRTYGPEFEKKCEYHQHRDKLVEELKRNLAENPNFRV